MKIPLLPVQPPHKADLTNPDLSILVQIVKDACAIGVASRYRELSKYNLRELCNPDAGKSEKQVSAENSKIENANVAKVEDKAAGKNAGETAKPETGKAESQGDNGKAEAQK